jgi:hypothetical protein
MSNQLAAKGHHMRKIVKNGEEGGTREGEATKLIGDHQEGLLKKPNIGGTPDVGRKNYPSYATAIRLLAWEYREAIFP